MPKKRLSTAQRSSSTTTTTESSTDSSDKTPSWDTSPNSFPAYFAALKRWILKQDERYKPLVEYGYVTIKGTIYCMSDNHIDRIRHKLDAVGKLSSPRQVARGDIDTDGLPVLTAEQKKADLESEDRKRYRVGPETCELGTTALMDTILSTIDDDETCDELEKDCGGHGCVLLQMFDTTGGR